ncbi:unnamed protein product [Schistocephalus solidus]|uniref:ANK_REP_REGION domain-containing protein n=1 Tax=Schistocephalus solidus TaxID=70667 RepID=A0A183SYP1_SCHSO|nr:unnamed protein product [Schistocephalus solidus]
MKASALLLYFCEIRQTADRLPPRDEQNVARGWTTELAKLMIEQGANINQGDMHGRTPLHVAAASDNAEMCTYLVAAGADLEARTNFESHTAVFFAARYDSCAALKVLIQKCKCQFDDLPSAPLRDSRLRTPLFVAAELDRSDAARMLLEFGADVKVRDRDGQTCMVPLITKMAPVAMTALNQFHWTSRSKREQYFRLYELFPPPNDTGDADECDLSYPSLFEVIVDRSHYDLLSHPAITALMDVMWKKFAR